MILNLKITNMNIISKLDIINLAYKHIVWNLNKTIIQNMQRQPNLIFNIPQHRVNIKYYD